MTIYVYLSGPIMGCTDEEALGWRRKIKKLLKGTQFETIDPVDRDYRGKETNPDLAAEIVEHDKDDINLCRYVIANTFRPSAGTSMEIIHAWEHGRRVVTIIHSDHISPWIRYHSDALVRTVETAVKRVMDWESDEA